MDDINFLNECYPRVEIDRAKNELMEHVHTKLSNFPESLRDNIAELVGQSFELGLARLEARRVGHIP